jgi:putative transcriptional regulator
MNDSDFDKFCESIKQAGEIKRGIRKPTRIFHSAAPDVKSIRERLGLSLSCFAALMGVSARTLQNWEQGRREPEGPAKALLRVVDRQPEAVGMVCFNK